MGVGGRGGVEVGPSLAKSDAGSSEFSVGLDKVALGFVEPDDGGLAGGIFGLDDSAILVCGLKIHGSELGGVLGVHEVDDGSAYVGDDFESFSFECGVGFPPLCSGAAKLGVAESSGEKRPTEFDANGGRLVVLGVSHVR